MTWVATGLFIAGVILTTYNTMETQKRQDNQATNAVQNQARRQRIADDRVNKGVDELAASNAQDERRQAMDSYLGALKSSKRSATVGPVPGGGAAFQEAANDANAQTDASGRQTAGLMATMESAGTQRMNEGFGYGRLATDVALIGRQAEGDAFVDQLKLNAIRRNPWIDMTAGALQGASGAAGGQMSTTGASQPAQTTRAPQIYNKPAGKSAYGTGG